MISAHGLGGGADLPIPANLAIVGGAAALTVSFTVLLIAWRRPRYTDASRGWLLPAWFDRAVDASSTQVVLRIVGLVLFGFGLMAALFGRDTTINPVIAMIYVWLWVGLIPLSLLFGPVVKALSPARTIHLALSALNTGEPRRGIAPPPERLGYWPAALGLLAFVWMELVSETSTELGTLRAWFAVYFAVTIVGALIWGDRWFEQADPFEVYSTLVAHLSPWSRDEEGRLTLVSPLRNLPRLEAAPGLVAVTAVLLGSTAFDSYRESVFWIRYIQSSSIDGYILDTVALTTTIVAVGLVFVLATTAMGPAGNRARTPMLMAHSLVPIIVGYMTAHYLSFLVESGQLTAILASDPFSNGANWFGTADNAVNYILSRHPTVLASIKVLAIVLGHLVGVIASHDKALQLLPRNKEVTGQLPLLIVMVAYTFGGLYLLFGV